MRWNNMEVHGPILKDNKGITTVVVICWLVHAHAQGPSATQTGIIRVVNRQNELCNDQLIKFQSHSRRAHAVRRVINAPDDQIHRFKVQKLDKTTVNLV